LHEWEGRTVEDWRVRWRLPAIVAVDTTGSTNDVARTLADDGAAAGTLVMAEHQTTGRGRMRRQWLDLPGRSLLMSFVLRPVRASGDIAPGTAPIRVGIAIAGALRDGVGIDARLKWPNDVVVTGGGKLAGILCEAASVGGETVIVAGIGINVLQQGDEWPAGLRDGATSIAQILGRAAPGRADVMDAIVPALRPLFALPLEPLNSGELLSYAAFDALRGLVVTTAAPDPVRGRVVGLAPDGALLIESAAGAPGRPARSVLRISSGSVRVTGPYTTSSAGTPR
jgi:BirA family biotin operon repressor/biotin-[acetyl-CoA-carboxylase] ligase